MWNFVSTDWYFRGWSFGFITINFFGVKLPEGESSFRAIMVDPS